MAPAPSSGKTSGANLLKFAACAILLTTFAMVHARVLAQSSSTADSPGASFAPQPGAAPSAPPEIAGQSEKDRTLEIAPQNGLVPPDKSVTVIPSDKIYKPSKDTASLERNFNPGGETSGASKPHLRPYIGIEVQYATKCFLGQEEHGLEIMKVDPNSPAVKAGLRGNRGTAATHAAEVLSGIAGPLEMLINPMLEHAAEGRSGDLIVAVDDHRVRSELDLDAELDKLKPGDTMYLTVIRPLPGGSHSTMKIAVKVGQPSVVAQGTTPPPGVPVEPPSGDEQYAY